MVTEQAIKKTLRRFIRNTSLPTHGVKPLYSVEIGPRRAFLRLSYGGYRLPAPGKIASVTRYRGIATHLSVGHATLSFVRGGL